MFLNGIAVYHRSLCVFYMPYRFARLDTLPVLMYNLSKFINGGEIMEKRPELNTSLDSKTFREYYYLKEELVSFCRENDLPVSGGKPELTERIALFLDTGNVPRPESRRKSKPVTDTELTKESIIENNFVCSEKHRAFFRNEIGKSFSFNVRFQKWLKSNAGKTYSDAVSAYYEILQAKKSEKTDIDKQFEYNTYIRDFFADNKGRTLDDAIKCWKYKKSMKGHNKYERFDLSALEQSEGE